MKIPTCPLPVWRALYDKAIAFRDIACWEWMSDTDVFGIQNVNDGEIGYCCVLGEMGEVFGLVVYLGAEGLETYKQISSGALDTDDPEARYRQQCLTVWFSDRAELEKSELAIAKRLGYNLMGRNVWPQFRSMQPGYCSWHVNESEAKFLTHCLDQAKLVALDLRDDDEALVAPKENHYLVRVPGRGHAKAEQQPVSQTAARGNRSSTVKPQPQPGETDLSWRSEWRQPAPPVKTPLPVFALDATRLQQIESSRRKSGGVWEIDAFHSPAPVDGPERPYFPYTFLCVDHDSGMVLNSTLSEPSKWPSEFPNALLKTFETTMILPSALWIGGGLPMELFEALGPHLDFEVLPAKTLPSLAPAKRELLKFLSRRS